MSEHEQRFVVVSWPDGCVVFDRRFGDTHALDAVTSKTLLARATGNAVGGLFARSASPTMTDEALETAIAEARTRLGLRKGGE